MNKTSLILYNHIRLVSKFILIHDVKCCLKLFTTHQVILCKKCLILAGFQTWIMFFILTNVVFLQLPMIYYIINYICKWPLMDIKIFEKTFLKRLFLILQEWLRRKFKFGMFYLRMALPANNLIVLRMDKEYLWINKIHQLILKFKLKQWIFLNISFKC